MPRINALRDQELAGDRSAAPAFQRAHRGRFVLDALQMLALPLVLIRMLR